MQDIFNPVTMDLCAGDLCYLQTFVPLGVAVQGHLMALWVDNNLAVVKGVPCLFW